MRVLVFGAGGVGGYFGGRLAQAGDEVSFIARGEHLRAIQDRGLLLDTDGGTVEVRPALATDDPARVGPVDVVLVAVKTWQVPDAARALGPALGPSTFVVPLQNGVEAASQLAAALGAERVVGGLCGTLSFIAGPGRIRSIGGTHFVRVGELDRRPSERTERLHAALARAGVTAEVPPDIHVALWEKFLFVVPLGGLGSVARAPIGVLRRMPETRRILEKGMREIEALARARGIALQGEVIARTMAFVDRLSPDGTTSLSRDIMDGRPSELDAWCGAVVRLGREAGVATPLHDVLYHSLLPLERRARGEKWIP
jgi:2-dehydropantoate 2-reductase